MKVTSVHKKIDWTPEDLARHKAIRERFQRDKPTLEELVASGEYSRPVLQITYWALVQLMHALKCERERQGLSLADVSKLSGIPKAALSRLENHLQINPTLNTLYRYAAALGKGIDWVLADIPAENVRPDTRKAGTVKNARKK